MAPSLLVIRCTITALCCNFYLKYKQNQLFLSIKHLNHMISCYFWAIKDLSNLVGTPPNCSVFVWDYRASMYNVVYLFSKNTLLKKTVSIGLKSELRMGTSIPWYKKINYITPNLLDSHRPSFFLFGKQDWVKEVSRPRFWPLPNS